MSGTAKKATVKKTAQSSATSSGATSTPRESTKAPENPNSKNPQIHDGAPKMVDQDFVYPTHQDPNRRLPGTTTYLDDVERENAEIARAKAEGREPNFENPPATQGTPLVPKNVFASTVPGDVELTTDVTQKVVAGRGDQSKSDKKDYLK